MNTKLVTENLQGPRSLGYDRYKLTCKLLSLDDNVIRSINHAAIVICSVYFLPLALIKILS